MKRSQPLRRRKPLRARKRLRAKPKPPRSDEEARLSRAWWESVTKGKLCAVTGAVDRPSDPIQGHHVVSQETLRRIARERGLDPASLLWDDRNGLPVARSVHSRHTSRYEPIPRSALRKENFEFADELGLSWLLDRLYPDAGSARS